MHLAYLASSNIYFFVLKKSKCSEVKSIYGGCLFQYGRLCMPAELGGYAVFVADMARLHSMYFMTST